MVMIAHAVVNFPQWTAFGYFPPSSTQVRSTRDVMSITVGLFKRQAGFVDEAGYSLCVEAKLVTTDRNQLFLSLQIPEETV